MEKFAIQETDDDQWLTSLFLRNGLEVSDSDEVDTDLVKRWAAYVGDERVGGCALALREGRHIVDGIAVEEGFRGGEIGKALLLRALEETRARGGRELYLVARAPGFFRKQGFETVERDKAPTFFECFGCPQYGKTCFPEVMRYSE